MRQLKTFTALALVCVAAVLLVALSERLGTGIGILLYIPFLLIAFAVISRLPLDDPLASGEQTEEKRSLRHVLRQARQAAQERPNRDLRG